MGKVSDNVNPKLIFSEGTVPASPSAGQQKLYVDTADHKLKRVDSTGTVTVVEGGGTSSTEDYDTAMAALSGKVHRWKFEETSGATIADSIGSLTLTLNGTAGTNYNRNITGPTGLGLATQLISAKADSASIGSVPVGAADRTVVAIMRTSSQTRQFPFAYGTAAAYQLFYPGLHDNGTALSLGHLSPSVGGGADLLDIPNVPISDGAWHMLAIGLRGSGKNRFGYLDGIYAQGAYATAANTVSTGIFRVGQAMDGTFQFVGDLADMAVFNRALSRAELDRLLRAAAL
jgi:hypothetical protein